MPRPIKNTVKIPFHIDQLQVGRTVKTRTHSRKLMSVIRDNPALVTLPDRDIPGLCNLQYRVVGLNRATRVVSLEYRIPGNGGSFYTRWPVEGLSPTFGIRL